jgi:hypothetical protein
MLPSTSVFSSASTSQQFIGALAEMHIRRIPGIAGAAHRHVNQRLRHVTARLSISENRSHGSSERPDIERTYAVLRNDRRRARPREVGGISQHSDLDQRHDAQKVGARVFCVACPALIDFFIDDEHTALEMALKGP